MRIHIRNSIQYPLLACFFLTGKLSIANSGDSIGNTRILLRDLPEIDGKARIHLHAEASVNSTALPAAFSNAFLFRKHLEREAVNRYSAALHANQNRIGGFVHSGGSYFWTPGNSWKANHAFAGISYAYFQGISLNFSKNLFDLAMKGNAGFAGTVVDFNNSNFYSIQYQTLKANYLKKYKNMYFRFALGLIQGFSSNEIRLEKASLFTASEGEYMDLGIKGQFTQSARADNRIGNGLPSSGPVGDFAMQWKGKHLFWDFSVEDAGFINWTEKTQMSQVDTSFRFSGIRIDNLFQINSSNLTGDSLKEALRGIRQTGRQMTASPARTKAGIVWMAGEHSGFSLYVRHIFIPGFVFEKQMAYHWERTLNKDMRMGFKLSISQGGFGRWNTALSLIPVHSKRHSLLISFSSADGWINPAKWKGNGLIINYLWNL